MSTPDVTDGDLIVALGWVGSWLSLLHRAGFPNVLRLIDQATMVRLDTQATAAAHDSTNLRESARVVLASTAHLAHPSLKALRETLAALEQT